MVVANPRKVRAFAPVDATPRRLAKTDALDAQALAHYGETLRPQPRALPEATRELKALVVRRQDDHRGEEPAADGNSPAEGAKST